MTTQRSPTNPSPLELPPDPRSQRRQKVLAATLLAVGLLCVCVGASLWGGREVLSRLQELPAAGETPQAAGPGPAEVVVAVSPVMAPTFSQLTAAFNTLELQTPDGQPMTVRAVAVTPEQMVAQSLQARPSFHALSPDSSLWLNQLERRWAEQQGTTTEESAVMPIVQRRTSTPERYAISPIVIAAWESVARDLGWPYESVGWQQIQRKATQDPDFKWNHPSTGTAAGLLATLAEFYAGAGLTRGLTPEQATAPETLEYVRAVEATIRFYGEGEDVIVERLRSEGREFLDAFVAQEQVVLAWNQAAPTERLVALYPREGTLWTDHPLALLEAPHITANQRHTYRAFVDYLQGEAAQQTLLNAGYRPADLSIPLDAPGSPFANTDAVDWREPQTTLQMPPEQVVEVVQNVWWYTKRPTNVYLVVDTSGSMEEGEKLERTQEALLAFIAEIRGDRDQVGLIEFGTEVKRATNLLPVDDAGRDALRQVVRTMEADGNTALLDAIAVAYQELIAAGDTEAINAIVVMSDGMENASQFTVRELEALFAGERQVQTVIFTIGFGSDADVKMLQTVAEIGAGQFRRADETDIRELYKVISTYF